MCAGSIGRKKNSMFLMENSDLCMAAEPTTRLDFGIDGSSGTQGIGNLIITYCWGDFGKTKFGLIGHRITYKPLLLGLYVGYTVERRPQDIRNSIIRLAQASFMFIIPVIEFISEKLVMEDYP